MNNYSKNNPFDSFAKKRPSELYEKRVSITLAGFQVTELFLKDYIETSYVIMQKMLSGVIEFSQSRKDIENYSLERLISTFKTINGNRELIKLLQTMVEHRNKLAHRALLPLYVHDLKISEEEYWKLIDEISPLAEEVEKCMEGIGKELVKLKQREGFILDKGTEEIKK